MKRCVFVIVLFLSSAVVASANPEVSAHRLNSAITDVPVALLAETYVIYFVLRRGIGSRPKFVAAYLPFTVATWVCLIFWPRYGHHYLDLEFLGIFRENRLVAEAMITAIETVYLFGLCRVLRKPDFPAATVWLIVGSALLGNLVSFLVGVSLLW